MHPNPNADLQLECYGAGYALLEPESEDIRYVLTDQGRRDLADARREELRRLVGPFDPKRSVGAQQSRCAACGRGQDTPSCSQRKHWGVL